ncbi:MAG: S8 family serine peptidase [Bacillota bacterium]|nr:S8 family serine peptidase [Bacillota bacterium]
MRKANSKILSTFTTVIFASSMVLNVNITNVAASDLHYDKMKNVLSEKLYKQSNLENSLKKLPKDSLKAVEKLKANNSTNANLSKLNPNEKVRLIVQLADEPAVKKSAAAASTVKTLNNIKYVKASQDSIIKKVENLTGSKVKQSYGYLVNGFSINAKRSDIDKIKAISGVKTVTVATTYHIDMNFAKELTQAYSTWSDLGYKGEGMVISIIDTGIDYNHKDLVLSDASKAKLTSKNQQGPGKYYTDKVPYAYNFADGNNDVIDKNPNTEMHGMHVAGIAAANGNKEDVNSLKAVQGVAPEAQLLDMKVFSNDPSSQGAYSDDIISAIEDSVLHGADVINMSLGSDNGFTDPEDPEQIAVKNAVNQGVVVVTAAGNASTSTGDPLDSSQKNLLGTVDTSTVGDPSTASDAISVASFENSKIVEAELNYTSNAQDGSGSMAFGKGSIDPDAILKDDSGYKLVDCGEGRNSYDTPDSTISDFDAAVLAGNIALVQCFDGTYASKELAAKDAGAIGIIFYGAQGDDTIISIPSYSDIAIPCMSITNSSAEKLKNLINNDLRIYFKGTKITVDNPDANAMSYFSSWGPTPSLDFKPELTAPGGNIYSLANNNSYQSLSGTSMATPNTSGGEALILQGIKAKNLGITGRELVQFTKNTTINTAKIEMDKQNNSIPYSPRRQGAGLLQIKDAINNNVIATDNNGNAAISLKQIGKTTTFTLNLKNYGTADASYTLPAGYILSESVDKSTSKINEYSISGADMSFDKNTVTVPAKGEAKVNVTINLPDSFSKQQYVEGFVKLVSNDSNIPSISVPYMAFYGDWSAVQNIDNPSWQQDSLASKAFSNFISNLIYQASGSKVQVNAQMGTELLTENQNGVLPCGLIPGDNFDPEAFTSGNTINLFSIDPNKIAFSPNADNSNDLVIPSLYHLRDVKNLKVDVLDTNKKVIRTLNNNINERKDLLQNNLILGLILGIMGTPNINYSWDGSLYDASTGQFATAPEGQYYIRITSKADMPNAEEQTIDMPVKLDVTAPQIKIISDSVGSDNTCLLKWTETDNVNGSGVNPAINAILINGQPVDEKNASAISYDEAAKTYSCSVKLDQDSNNLIEIGAQDYAGNTGMDNIYVKSGNPDSISFDNLSDNMKINNKSFTIKGKVRDDVKALSINGSNVNIENNSTFSQTVELQEGANTIIVKALDNNNNELFNKTYNVDCDDIAPELTLTEPSLDSEGRVYTADTSLTISGKVTDAHQLTLKINGEDTQIDSNGNFITKVDIQDSTYIPIESVDDYGNATYTGINVMYTANTVPFSVSFDNLGAYMILPKIAADKDVYLITGHVNHPVSVFNINDTAVTINKDLSFSIPVKLSQGKNAIKVYAEDDNHNVLMDQQYKVFYANEAPKLIMSNPSINADGNIYTNQDSLNVSGQTVSQGFDYSLYIDGNSVSRVVNSPTNSNNDFSYNVPVKNGDKLDIVLKDDAGNTYEDITNVVVDKAAPKAPAIILDNLKPTNKNVLVTVSADKDDKDIANIEYSFDHNTWLQYDAPFNVSSNKKVYARLIDFAGNSSEASLDITNIDKTPPVISISGVENGKSYNSNIKPSVTTNEGTLTMQLDNNVYNGEEITSEGKHLLKVSAVDAAGNSTNQQVSFVIDKTPPVISVAGLESGGTYYNKVSPKISVNEGTYSATLDDKEYTGADITTLGNHKLTITSKDEVNNVSTKTINFTIVAAISNDSDSAGSAGKAIVAASDKTENVTLINTTIINKSFFGEIAGSDRNASFTVNSNNTPITWTFSGKDINASNIKDIDLSLNIEAPNKKVISKLDSNAQIISFKDNGVLPAPATLKIKIDSTKVDISKGIYFYYYNPASKDAELIAGPLTPDADGYVTVTVKHCSDYFFSNNDNTKVQQSVANLPKTGSIVDMKSLMVIGIGFIVSGAMIVFRRRKYNKA